MGLPYNRLSSSRADGTGNAGLRVWKSAHSSVPVGARNGAGPRESHEDLPTGPYSPAPRGTGDDSASGRPAASHSSVPSGYQITEV